MVFIVGMMINQAALAENYPTLSAAQEQWLGQQIFNNECAMQVNCLTAWNLGEDFPSLGLGHFIWYKKDQKEIFEESFPALIKYFEEQNISIPAWLKDSNYNAPWQSRDEFLADFSGTELSELRSLLADTFPQQTSFIIQRFNAALNRMVAVLPENETSNIEEKFFSVANSHPPYGMYALIDYVNFKGEGVSSNERYIDQGWGLLQVLTTMPTSSENTLENFISSAKTVLQNRVRNAPEQRNEEQWLRGWFNRLDTYLPNRLEPGSTPSTL
ncbi:MAG: hypothetical protein COA71_13640 [SAR86 cluster bacterium]|uniref:Uncharacterized protein n=1 Tax=SAR86 cluster bacterium TaxID=2030880 RepID=A0A2A5C7Y6_9GAMM|nr:MAG: hypothetical protein COA71_13640 [SAR86 cluster bacterium]